jgi:hypothetical protein
LRCRGRACPTHVAWLVFFGNPDPRLAWYVPHRRREVLCRFDPNAITLEDEMCQHLRLPFSCVDDATAGTIDLILRSCGRKML